MYENINKRDLIELQIQNEFRKRDGHPAALFFHTCAHWRNFVLQNKLLNFWTQLHYKFLWSLQWVKNSYDILTINKPAVQCNSVKSHDFSYKK